MISIDVLLKNDNEISNVEIKNLMKIYHRTKNNRLKEKIQVKIFLKLSKITIKNIKNFINYCQIYSSTKEIVLEDDDLINECFIIFYRCLNFFDERKGDFIWFYNKSLIRGLLRLNGKLLFKYKKDIDIDEILHQINFTTDTDLDFTNLYFELCNFSKEEQLIAISKLNGETNKAFLKKNNYISTKKYYELMNDIKNKLKFLRDDKENGENI